MKKILLGVVASLGLLVSSSCWGASGDQPIKLNSASVGATVTVSVVSYPANLDIRNLTTARDSVNAVQSGAWTVSVSGTPSIRYLDKTTDSIKIYGDQNVPFKQDSNGQIYAITAPETGTNIRKTYVFSNFTAGSWGEVGSYTVTAGKTLKIYDVHATGRFAVDFKVSDGTVAQDIYLATSPSNGADNTNITRPVPIAAGTVVRVSVKPDDSVNSGAISFGGFEY